ncbi:MAG: M56 family metallopeptidase [Actinobacteria bacterium]|nr:M56 family metallopeptidase [Actinomycetota bacterium]
MNSALCLLVYGVVLVWLCPPALARLTRAGRNPALSIMVWLSTIALALGAWVAAGAGVLAEVVSMHSVRPVQYCVDMLLAVGHLGWAGQLGLAAAGIAGLGVSVVVARRLAVTLRRLWSRSREHAHAAHLLGASTSRPGVVVLSAEQPTAYCVAGRPHAIVVTTGAVASLSERELAAVLAHEQAHVSGRHPQLMMTLRALAISMPRLPLLAAAVEAVGSLVEMCADDRAARRYGRDTVLCSLMALAGGPRVGPGLGAADTAVVARAARLAGPVRRWPQWRQRLLLSATLTLLLAVPAVIITVCHT